MSSQATATQLQATRPTTPESSLGLRSLHRPRLPQVVTKWVWLALQWKWGIDESASWYRLLYFRFAFLPLLRFSKWVMGINPPTHRDPDGNLGWIEWQGVFADEASARFEAIKHPYGHIVKVPFDSELPACTCETSIDFPESPPTVRELYRRTRTPDNQIALAQLAEKVAATDALVRKFS